MNLYDEHAESLAELQDELAADCPVFTWPTSAAPGTGVYKCLVSGAQERKPLDMGGFTFDSALRITVLTATLGMSAEAARDAMSQTDLIYRGKTYRIENVTLMPTGAQLRLECKDANSV